MAKRDDVTVRIDTALREQARKLQINMSRLLEESLRNALQRLEASRDSSEIRLDLEDTEGRVYVGKFRGTLLGGARDVEVYVTEDNRIIAVDVVKRHYAEIEDPRELEDWFPHDRDVYADVMHALGETPEVDI